MVERGAGVADEVVVDDAGADEDAAVGVLVGVARMNSDTLESGYMEQTWKLTLETIGEVDDDLVLASGNRCFAIHLALRVRLKEPILVLQGIAEERPNFELANGGLLGEAVAV